MLEYDDVDDTLSSTVVAWATSREVVVDVAAATSRDIDAALVVAEWKKLRRSDSEDGFSPPSSLFDSLIAICNLNDDDSAECCSCCIMGDVGVHAEARLVANANDRKACFIVMCSRVDY